MRPYFFKNAHNQKKKGEKCKLKQWNEEKNAIIEQNAGRK